MSLIPLRPEVMEYVTLAKVVITGGAAAWTTFRARTLSRYEKDLLRAAADSGQFALLTAAQLPGPIVRAGAVTFPDHDGAPALDALYRDAFERLIRRGYVEHIIDQRFSLTSAGFARARTL